MATPEISVLPETDVDIIQPNVTCGGIVDEFTPRLFKNRRYREYICDIRHHCIWSCRGARVRFDFSSSQLPDSSRREASLSGGSAVSGQRRRLARRNDSGELRRSDPESRAGSSGTGETRRKSDLGVWVIVDVLQRREIQ